MSIRGAAALLLITTSVAAGDDPQDLHAGASTNTAPVSFVDASAIALLDARATRGMKVNVPVHGLAPASTLSLEPNERLLTDLSELQIAALSPMALYRGRIEGMDRSWVRLSRVGGQWEGLLWNGTELFGIGPAHASPPTTRAKLVATDAALAIYPLSELKLAERGAVCAVGEEQRLSAAPSYESLVSELRQNIAAAAVPPEQIQIAFVADFEFRTLHAAQTSQALLARINAVDGIFSEQVGVTIVPSEVRIFETSDDPFDSGDAQELLNQLATFRESDATVRSAGLAHLFTGRDRGGTTIGIAYIDSLCEAFGGSGVTFASDANLFIDTLVAAHEIGHNFGADHDGEAGSPCANVGSGFIMWPSVSGSGQFSECSVNTMRPRIEAAECITPSRLGDASVELAPTISAGNGVPFDIPIDVRSAGTGTVDGVTLTSQMISLSNLSVTTEQGTCAFAQNTLNCQLGSIPAGQTRRVMVRGTISMPAPGTIQVSVSIAAANDRIQDNNHAATQIVVSPVADVTAGPGQTLNGFTRAAIPFSVDISSIGPQAATDVALNLHMHTLQVLSASLEGGACTLTGFNSASCTVASIPAGTSRRLDVEVRGDHAGQVQRPIMVSASNDGNSFNNATFVTVVLAAAADARASIVAAPHVLMVGDTATYSAVVESTGPQPINDVVARVHRSPVHELESVTAQGAACIEETPDTTFACNFGSLPSGSSRRIDVAFRATQLGSARLGVFLQASDDDERGNNSASRELQVLPPVDVQLFTGVFVPGMIQGQTWTKRFEIRSLGAQPGTGGTFTAQLPAGFAIAAARVAGGGCSIAATTVTCNLPALVRGSPTFVELDLRTDLTGQFSGNVAVSVPGDVSAGNDSFVASFNVLPLVDVGVTHGGNVSALIGEPFFVVASLATGPNAMTQAWLRMEMDVPAVVESIEPAGVCNGADPLDCLFASLPANSVTQVRVRLRGVNPGTYRIAMRLVNGGMLQENDETEVMVLLENPADASIGNNINHEVAPNQEFVLQPLVMVDSGRRAVNDVNFRATIPNGLTMLGVTTDLGTCASTASEVVCALGTIQGGARATMEIRLRAPASGTFTSNWSFTAANDTSPDWNTAAITITVTNPNPPPPPPPPSNDGGGGGGGTGLVTLLTLAYLALRRHRPALCRRCAELN